MWTGVVLLENHGVMGLKEQHNMCFNTGVLATAALVGISLFTIYIRIMVRLLAGWSTHLPWMADDHQPQTPKIGLLSTCALDLLTCSVTGAGCCLIALHFWDSKISCCAIYTEIWQQVFNKKIVECFTRLLYTLWNYRSATWTS